MKKSDEKYRHDYFRKYKKQHRFEAGFKDGLHLRSQCLQRLTLGSSTSTVNRSITEGAMAEIFNRKRKLCFRTQNKNFFWRFAS